MNRICIFVILIMCVCLQAQNIPMNPAIVINQDSADLSWSSVPDANYYCIYRSDNPETGFVKIDSVSSTFYSDDTINSSNKYFYYITSVTNNTNMFEWCTVDSGEYTCGQGDTLKVIDYSYKIMKNEVTNQQYVDFLAAALNAGEITVSTTSVEGNYEGDANYSAGTYEFLDLDGNVWGYNCKISWNGFNFVIANGYEDHPVTFVTWFGSWAFVEHYCLRLPESDEWEKAARGNTGFNYPWGNSIDGSRANYAYSGDPWDDGTTPIGMYNGQTIQGFATTDSPSPYGAYDMAGNVWEWTNSWSSNSPTYHTMRGGDFYSNNLYSQSWWNGSFSDPLYGNFNLGFRCVEDIVNNPPNPPFNPDPMNNETGVPLDKILSWECSDPENDPLTYDVYFGIDSDPPLISSLQSETFFTPEFLVEATTYYWKIVAHDQFNSTIGDIWQFTTEDILQIDWCNIPAGEYTYGEGDTLKLIDYDYQIMKYQVTNQQYVDYLIAALDAGELTVSVTSVEGYYEGDANYTAGIYEFLDLDDDDCRIDYNGSSFTIVSGYENHPVIEVSWLGAWAFAEYFDLRLPTDHEWEKAARGNTGFDYPWGDNIDGSRANYIDSGDPWDNGTTPVGMYNGQSIQGFATIDSPSPYSVYDMAGNVWEWVSSWYSSSARKLRGGSWIDGSYHSKSWGSSYYEPTWSNYNFGFRCVKD